MKKLLLLLLLPLSFSANALDIDDANCAMLVSHFDSSGGWFSGLVVQNLGNAQTVTIRSYENNALGGGGDLPGASTRAIDVPMAQAEKATWTLTADNPLADPKLLETGLSTGWLLVLSDFPVTGFILFGLGAPSPAITTVGPLMSDIGGDCIF